MDRSSRYVVPLAALDSVRVPVEQQVEEQDVDVDRDYLAPEELARVRLLGITGPGG